eukprot:3979404-Amphidinium_carterae.1
MPLWCAKDTRRWFYGAVVPTKGVEHPYNVQEVKRQILAGGFTVVLRSSYAVMVSILFWRLRRE